MTAGLKMLLPRLVRFRDVPFYLDMDRNRLNPIAQVFVGIRTGDSGSYTESGGSSAMKISFPILNLCR